MFTKFRPGFALLGLGVFLVGVSGFAEPIDAFPWRLDPLWSKKALEASPVKGEGLEEAWRSPQLTGAPGWAQGTIARIVFNPRDDQRKDDIERFRINEGGLIDGRELLALTQPKSGIEYECFLELPAPDANPLACIFAGGWHPTNPGVKARHAAYLGTLADRGMAALALARILDHEAMKHRLSPEPSDAVVRYVVGSILLQNAINKGRWTGKSPGRDVLYSWLREHFQGDWFKDKEYTTLHIDWTFTQDMQTLRRVVADREEIDYPSHLFRFVRPALGIEPKDIKDQPELIPATVGEFETEIRRQLLPVHRTVVRKLLWRALFAKSFPDLADPFRGAVVTRTQLNRARELSGGKLTVVPTDAEVTDLVISGPRASAFRDRFYALLRGHETELTIEAMVRRPQRGASPSELAEYEAWYKPWAAEQRQKVPAEVFAKVSAELAADLDSGRVRASLAPRVIRYKGTEGIFGSTEADEYSSKRYSEGFCDSGEKIDLFQKAKAQGALFEEGKLFPDTEHAECSGPLRIMLGRTQVKGKPFELPAGDPRFEWVMRRRLAGALQGIYERELALRLFRDNRLVWVGQTCSEPGWPCGTKDPRRLAEVLFGETLFPGLQLGEDGPGRPITSTLGRPELYERVMGVDATGLNATMLVPNGLTGVRHAPNGVR